MTSGNLIEMPITYENKVELFKIFPHYYGNPNENFKLFLAEYDEKCGVFEINDNEKMEFLPALLHGPASGKIKYLQAKQWEEFSEQLVIIMEKVKNAECSKLMLQQAKQDDQTIMEYGNKMDNLSKAASVFEEQSDEMELIKQFIRGLKYDIKKVIRRQKYSTFLEVVKAASDEEQQQTVNKTTTMFDQMSLESYQQRDNWRLDNYGGNHFRTPNWNCKCGYLNYGFRKQCNSCRTFRNGGTSNGFNNRGNSDNRGGGNYNNRGNFNRGCGKLGNRGNNNGRGNLNNCGQQQQQGQQNEKKISNHQQKRHQRSHSDPTTKATTKENKKKPEKNGEATVDSEKEEPAFYLD